MPPKGDDPQFWMGQVDATLKDIRRTLERNHQECLDGIINIHGRLDVLESENKDDNPSPSPSVADSFDPEKVVQWSWIRDEILLPVIRHGVTLVVAYWFGKLTGVIP